MSHRLIFVTFGENKARRHLQGLSFQKVKNLVKLLNIGNDWYHVNQQIEDHRRQLIGHIISRTVTPYEKIKNKLMNIVTPEKSEDSSHLDQKVWNPKKYQNYQSVVHFIHDEYGTGVNINPNGIILTCAHVISHADDPEGAVIGEGRVGRMKIIMFPNGRLFQCQCFKVLESDTLPDQDLALLRIKSSISTQRKVRSLPFSNVSRTEPVKGESVFCVGNPGSSRSAACVSCGKFEGTQRTKKCLGKYVHSCWTYYGHSGAALFNSRGEIVGVHNSWNHFSSKKHAISLPCIREFIV